MAAAASGSVLLIGTLGGGGAGVWGLADAAPRWRQANHFRVLLAEYRRVRHHPHDVDGHRRPARASGLESRLRDGIQQLQHGRVLRGQAPKTRLEHGQVPQLPLARDDRTEQEQRFFTAQRRASASGCRRRAAAAACGRPR